MVTVEINGQDVEFEKPPTAEDIDYAANQLGISEQGQQQDTSEIKTGPSGSPLTFLERGKFAFGEERGRRAFLEKKFPDAEITQVPVEQSVVRDAINSSFDKAVKTATGVMTNIPSAILDKLSGGKTNEVELSQKFAVNGIPVDPPGFNIADLPADMTADIADELVRIGFQLGGAGKGFVTGGVTAGPIGAAVGTIVGGGAGRATGQGVVEIIGKALGIRESELPDVIRDIAGEGLIGAAGEAVGVGMRQVTDPTVKFLKNIFNKVHSKTTKPFIQQLFRTTAGIPQESTQRVQELGAKNVLTRKNMSEEAVGEVAQKIQDAVIKTRKILGDRVGAAQKALVDSGKKVNIGGISKFFDDTLMKLRIIDRTGKINKITSAFGDSEVIKNINVVRDLLKKAGTTIGVEDAIDIRTSIDDILRFSREGKLTIGTKQETALLSIANLLRDKVNNLSDDMAKANADFADFAKVQQVFDELGITDLKRAESILKRILKQDSSSFVKKQVIKMNNLLKGDDKFLEQLKTVIAARDFKMSGLLSIRQGVLSSALGFAQGPLGVAAGFTLSTPRAVGQLIKGGQAAGQAVTSTTSGVGKLISGILPKAASGEISRQKQ